MGQVTPSAELTAIDLLRVDIDSLESVDLDDHIHAACQCMRGLSHDLSGHMSRDMRRNAERLRQKLQSQLARAQDIRMARQAVAAQIALFKQQRSGGGSVLQP